MTVHFNLCLAPDVIEAEPDLLPLVKAAGVTDIWTTGFLYGHWYYTLSRVEKAIQAIEAAGLTAHLANLPLGHPGDSLGSKTEDVPLGPPAHWRMGVNADGAQHSGTSLHKPAVEENCQAIKDLASIGVRDVFLDDDYRLAPAPGMIGGCFCDEHRQRFLAQHGLDASQWDQLLHDVAHRAFTPLLRQWVDFTCDELTAMFRAQQQAVPGIDLGIMVMVMGSEKAGIRLSDYSDALFRVGEFMFNDVGFNPVKGKTDELFSVLFHRRFCAPERSYSESTAFPADQLSARNMAAKLVISTIADVRNTMFMSGLTPFPRAHWSTLKDAIQLRQRLSALTAGHRLAGPLKHYWGMASRYTSDDNAFSLFLAMGIPFEVTAEPRDGWTFLSQADAQHLSTQMGSVPGAHLVYRPGDCASFNVGMPVEESLPALFELKHHIVSQLKDVPYIVEDSPAVCAWYPDAGCVLVWNLDDAPQTLTVRLHDWTQVIRLDGLGVEAVKLPTI